MRALGSSHKKKKKKAIDRESKTYCSCIFLIGTRRIVPFANLTVQTGAIQPSIGDCLSVNVCPHPCMRLGKIITIPNANSGPNPFMPSIRSNY